MIKSKYTYYNANISFIPIITATQHPIFAMCQSRCSLPRGQARCRRHYVHRTNGHAGTHPFITLFVFHLCAAGGAAAATAGTTSAGVGTETTRAVSADFTALFVNHLRAAGAGAPRTSAASAGDFATCATGGPARLPAPSLAVAPATGAMISEGIIVVLPEVRC